VRTGTAPCGKGCCHSLYVDGHGCGCGAGALLHAATAAGAASSVPAGLCGHRNCQQWGRELQTPTGAALRTNLLAHRESAPRGHPHCRRLCSSPALPTCHAAFCLPAALTTTAPSAAASRSTPRYSCPAWLHLVRSNMIGAPRCCMNSDCCTAVCCPPCHPSAAMPGSHLYPARPLPGAANYIALGNLCPLVSPFVCRCAPRATP
jgi:hypothetical protein